MASRKAEAVTVDSTVVAIHSKERISGRAIDLAIAIEVDEIVKMEGWCG